MSEGSRSVPNRKAAWKRYIWHFRSCKCSRLNPFLIALYYLLKVVVYTSLQIFHRGVGVVHKHWTKLPGPLIVVSNHPATVLDPLNVVVHVKGIVFFLANASLFKYKWSAWLLSKLYCIPVERPQDVNGGPPNNDQNFSMAQQHLSNKGKLYVAVEGSSFIERRLRKVKTGAARIALQAEAAHDFRLGVSILPAGLNYEDPNGFRKPVLVIYDEPLRVADFKQLYETDETKAVVAITNAIAQRLEKITIHTADDEEDDLLRKMETLHRNQAPLPLYQHFLRTKALQKKLRDLAATSPMAYQAFAKRLKAYFERLGNLGITDEALIAPLCPLRLLLLIIGLPFALAGWLMHWPPSSAIKALSGALNKDIHWRSTYNYVPSLVLYPVFFLVEALVLSIWLPDHGWLFAVVFIVLGLWWEWYSRAAGVFLKQLKMFTGNKAYQREVAQAKEERKNLLLEYMPEETLQGTTTS